MRRLISVCLLLCLLLSAAARGEAHGAMELARRMAESVPSVSDIRRAANIDGARDRARWTDSQSGGNCSLLIYPDEAQALTAAVRNANARNLVRSVGACNLYLGRCSDTRLADTYEAALRALLGIHTRREATYILNVNTRRFHVPTCSSTRAMKEKNQFSYAGERQMLLDQGYKACKRCKP